MRINHTVRILITSDFLINAGFAVFTPVFAVFVTQQVEGASIQTVGFAAAITQIVKALVQIPVARYLDRNHGEYDDFISMITGSAIVAIVPFTYLWVSNVTEVFIAQAFYGLGMALAVPPWFAIFTRHIDHLKENFEWSLESVGIGISGAGAAALSGIIVSYYDFRAVFVLGGIFAIFGALMQLKIYRDLRKYVGHREVQPHPHKVG